MTLEQARKLTIGQRVYCPADRGDSAYGAVVRHVGDEVHINTMAVRYVWVTVTNNGRSAVWPSNRLG